MIAAACGSTRPTRSARRFVDAIDKLVQPLPRADRASMGFPGVVRKGVIVTAPHFVTKRGRAPRSFQRCAQRDRVRCGIPDR